MPLKISILIFWLPPLQIVSVSDDKIKITILILRRGALSSVFVYCIVAAFVFGLCWVLRSSCICVLYRCRALWSNRAIKLQGRQCQMSPVQLQDKNVKYIKVQKHIWQKRIKCKTVLNQNMFIYARWENLILIRT